MSWRTVWGKKRMDKLADCMEKGAMGMNFEYVSTGHLPLAYRLKELPVFFSDERCLETIQMVLDESGRFRDFPGITEDERWTKELTGKVFPDVRFEAQFYRLDDGSCLVEWLIQPDGWYWMDDDGYGFNGDSSIMLYSVVDNRGVFTEKFELFSIAQTCYCHDYDDVVK
ncbi:MAG: hypothetical protein LUF30_01320 [Lachnospiraceae bacterium]|nr:hypothetical protein [Lachnospiraceae bacterium]